MLYVEIELLNERVLDMRIWRVKLRGKHEQRILSRIQIWVREGIGVSGAAVGISESIWSKDQFRFKGRRLDCVGQGDSSGRVIEDAITAADRGLTIAEDIIRKPNTRR